MRPREEIRAVLADFDLLHDLTEGGTVSRSVLAANTDLLSSLALQRELDRFLQRIIPCKPRRAKRPVKHIP